MGHMMDGKWIDDDRITADTRGAFVRADSQFRSWITATAARDLRAAPVSKRSPAAIICSFPTTVLGRTATIIFRKLKKLEDVISMSLADKPKAHGWAYSEGIDDFHPEDDGIFRLHQVYAAADPKYTGKVTVPTLWDRERRTIVNNESSEIIRMFNSAFAAFTEVDYDFYPEDLRGEIDRINELVYSHFNNGVYRAGFARSQEAYEEAARKVFICLDDMERLLGARRYLAGDRSPKPIGALFRRCCASISFTTATSNATCAGSRIIPIWRIICASSISGRGSKTPSICRKSKRVTTASVMSTRRASCRSGRLSIIWNCRTTAVACRRRLERI